MWHQHQAAQRRLPVVSAALPFLALQSFKRGAACVCLIRRSPSVLPVALTRCGLASRSGVLRAETLVGSVLRVAQHGCALLRLWGGRQRVAALGAPQAAHPAPGGGRAEPCLGAWWPRSRMLWEVPQPCQRWYENEMRTQTLRKASRVTPCVCSNSRPARGHGRLLTKTHPGHNQHAPGPAEQATHQCRHRGHSSLAAPPCTAGW